MPSSDQIFIWGRVGGGMLRCGQGVFLPSSDKNFIFEGGGVTLSYSKCQVLTKISLGGGGILGYLKCQVLTKFSFGGEGGRDS